MSNIFKNLGKGVLYVIAFPFIILAIALAGVAGIFIFIYELIKIIVLFFAGKSIFTPLDEDIKAKAILDGVNQVDKEVDNTNPNPPTPENDYQVYTTGPYTNTVPQEDEEEEEIVVPEIGDENNDD